MIDARVPADLPAEVVETHTAVLFFVGDRVYKMKKPVDVGFLDFSTLEARRKACEDEVALNARLAPDAYLGVAEVRGPGGEPCEHLVVMRRMPTDRRLAACVGRGDDIDDELRAIAHRVAALHEQRPPDAGHDRLGQVNSIRARWTAGFEQIRDLGVAGHDEARDARIEDLVVRYLAGRTDLFDLRIRRGRIRDGHGDLMAEDIFLLPEGPQILDCLEFCEDYRWGDVLGDVAFLAMDLERLGRPDLGDRFLDLHAELSGDSWPGSLAHHYIAYRAHVRAKVGLLRCAQEGEPADPATEALFAQALRHLEAGRVRLVVTGGAPGTGKSTVAAAIGERLGAVVLRSDELRSTVGLSHDYRPESVHAVYGRMVEEAGRLLRRGEHVVLDATFRHEADRALVRRLATDATADLTELCCVLPSEVAAARVAERVARGGDVSDATPDIARRLAGEFEAWPQATAVDTTACPAEVAEAASAAVG